MFYIRTGERLECCWARSTFWKMKKPLWVETLVFSSLLHSILHADSNESLQNDYLISRKQITQRRTSRLKQLWNYQMACNYKETVNWKQNTDEQKVLKTPCSRPYSLEGEMSDLIFTSKTLISAVTIRGRVRHFLINRSFFVCVCVDLLLRGQNKKRIYAVSLLSKAVSLQISCVCCLGNKLQIHVLQLPL